jgi:hypothetical protein
LLLKYDFGPLICPEDRGECTRKPNAEGFPKNFALIRLAEKTVKKLEEEIKKAAEFKVEEETRMSFKEDLKSHDDEDLCSEHGRKREIICIKDRSRICSNCALFGNHKGHDVRMEQEVVGEITVRTDLLIEMFQLV